MHLVERRFSDFEYLLQQLQLNENFKNFVLPSLPEKKLIGNMDDEFIKERRDKLEGFLRYLLDKDNRIKSDQTINAFLTYDTAKWQDFKKNPTSYMSKVRGLYD